MKQYALLTISVLCVLAVSCGSNDLSTADRVSRPGEYAGYGDAIFADEYNISSRYVQVSDGTKLAMDLYRPKDKTTGQVVDAPLPVIWMHTPYNRRYNNNNSETLTVDEARYPDPKNEFALLGLDTNSRRPTRSSDAGKGRPQSSTSSVHQ